MPLYKTIEINNATKVLIWKIEESFNELLKEINLTENSKSRVNTMKSELHKKGFLAIRQLFKIAGYSDKDVVYDEFGKPHLTDGNYISITHSFQFCGLIISEENPVGIDIEKQREKIVKIAHKFTPIEEYKHIKSKKLVKKLTVVWGAKESLYKIFGKKELSFKKHIYIDEFDLKDSRTTGDIKYNKQTSTYFISFFEFEEFTCVYAF